MTVYVYNNILNIFSISGIILVVLGSLAFVVPIHETQTGSITIHEASGICHSAIGFLAQSFGGDSGIEDRCDLLLNLTRLAYLFIITGFLLLVLDGKTITETK